VRGRAEPRSGNYERVLHGIHPWIKAKIADVVD
jgi:hypothetical protein